jgi:hypothetical protein
VSKVASRLRDEAEPGQILISPRVLTKVENAVKVEPVSEFELKGIRRPLAATSSFQSVHDFSVAGVRLGPSLKNHVERPLRRPTNLRKPAVANDLS